MFVRHHCHSIHSARDGMIPINQLVKIAKEAGESVSLCDHGSIGGWIDLYNESKKQEVKPIFGCEFYINKNRDRLFEVIELINKTKDKNKLLKLQKERDNINVRHHLVIVAKNLNGLMNIIKLNNIAYTDGFYYKPTINYDNLFNMNKDESGDYGVIISSACMQGPPGVHIRNDDLDSAIEWAKMMQEKFGDDLYLEVQSNGIEEQKKINRGLLEISALTGANLCIGMDSHYITQKDSETHQDMLLLQSKKTRSDVGKTDIKITWENAKGEHKSRKLPAERDFRKGIPAGEVKVGDKIGKDVVIDVKEVDRVWSFATDFIWYKSEKDIIMEIKKYHPEIDKFIDIVLDGNYQIYDKIENIEFNTDIKLPIIENEEKVLAQMIKDGIKKHNVIKREYIDRIKYELNIIKDKGFCAYFIILADFIQYAIANNIPTGTARGSAAGSLVAYVLDIHRIDPMDKRWGNPLPFERFLSPDRGREVYKIFTDEEGKEHKYHEKEKLTIIRDNNEIEILVKDIQENDEILTI